MRSPLPLIAAALLPLLAACEPTCKQACDKLLECEEVETPRQALEDCRTSCELQQALYEDWEDLQAREALADLKSCVMGAECSEISEGVCYDQEVYVW